jgi:hypothetical protein
VLCVALRCVVVTRCVGLFAVPRLNEMAVLNSNGHCVISVRHIDIFLLIELVSMKQFRQCDQMSNKMSQWSLLLSFTNTKTGKLIAKGGSALVSHCVYKRVKRLH